MRPCWTPVFIGFTQGVDQADASVSRGDTVTYSHGESSVGDTKSILLLFDKRLGGYSDDEICPEYYELPHHVAVYMAGNQNQPQYDENGCLITDPSMNRNLTDAMLGQNLATHGATMVASASASSQKIGVQALADLMITLDTLLEDPVTPENVVARNAEIRKCHEQMAKIQEDINAENTRLAER